MRRWAAASALSVAALALVATAAWQYRVPVLAWTAARLLERQGLGPARFVIDAVDLDGLRISDVALRGGALKARKVTASYGLRELAAAHLRRVEIDGLDLAFTSGKDGITLGGRPLGRAGSGGGSATAGWSIDAITLSDARLALDSAAGPIEATVSATLALTPQEIRGSAVSATVAVPVAAQRRQASIVVQEVAWSAAGGGRLRIAGAALSLDGMPWTAQAIAGEFVRTPDGGSVRLDGGRLVDLRRPALIAPLLLSGMASLGGARLDFELHAAAGPASAARLEAKGQYDRSSGGGAARIVMEPLAFKRGSVQPADIFPRLAGFIEEADGSVAAAGSLRWRGVKMSPDLTVRLENLGFATAVAQVHGLDGTLRIVSLWPPATPPAQMLSATIEAAGLPPARIRLEGQLTTRPSLALDSVAVAVAGGTIEAMPFTIDPAAPLVDTALRIDHLDLAEITTLLGIDGLSGTGQLDGRIPLRIENGKVTLGTGRLAARAPGILQYRPGKLPKEIAAAGEPVELALEALSDFHYDSLAIDLDKSAGGEGTVLLRLAGRNPAVRSGQPFAFNIRIASNFDRLADYALLSLESAQRLLRRAAERDQP